MVQRSQNGRPVITTAQTRLWNIPVKSGPHRTYRFADNSDGFVLAHLVLRYHEYVEPINEGVWDEWGHANRNVRGSSSTISNHASGTAADVNATKHPLGVAGTFKRVGRLAKVLALVAFYRAVVRWGGEYHGRKDEMHWEINASPERVQRMAEFLATTSRGKRILNANRGFKPPTKHRPGTRTLSEGDKGGDVIFVQRKVGAYADGEFGPVTAGHVQEWKRLHKGHHPNLDTSNGVVGKITWQALGVAPRY